MSGLEEALALTLSLMSDLVQEKNREKTTENVKDRMNGQLTIDLSRILIFSHAGEELLGRNRHQIQSLQEIFAKEKF